MITVPKQILWDYRGAPEDLRWRLQRIADFFPRYGSTEGEVRVEGVLEFLHGLGMGVPDYQHIFDRRIFLLPAAPEGPLKVEFTRYPFPRCESGSEIDGLVDDAERKFGVHGIRHMLRAVPRGGAADRPPGDEDEARSGRGPEVLQRDGPALGTRVAGGSRVERTERRT